MVRKNPDAYKPEDRGPKKPWRVPEPESERLPREHAEYWSPEAVACRERFTRAAGMTAIREAFHIRDDFRIVCDGILADGSRCGNNVGMAPLPDDHDGLCEGCRANRRPHPPRVTMDPSCVVWGPRGDAWEGS